MIQGRSRLRFTLESGQDLCILGDFVRQELESDEAVELYILGLVDHTHPAAAQLLQDAVMPDDLADHRVEMLGPQVEQVNEWHRAGQTLEGRASQQIMICVTEETWGK